MDYQNVQLGTALDISPQGPIDRLEQRKRVLEAELEKVDSALAALKANPQIAELLQLVGRALS